MPDIYYVINDGKEKKTYQKAIQEQYFLGKSIGETVPGTQLGLTGYELQITGGSDTAGFPMLKHIEGQARRSLLMGRGKGAPSIKRKGMRLRRTMVGNTISPTTAQVNLKVVKYGTKSVPDLLGIQPKEEKDVEATPKEDVPKAEAPNQAPEQKSQAAAKPEEKKEAAVMKEGK